MAATVRRRWFSYKRRNANALDAPQNRLTDLSSGLAAQYETGGLPMAGALIVDYNWLCEQLIPILLDAEYKPAAPA
jgi:hypothetical protein